MKQVNGPEQNISSLHLWPYIIEYERGKSDQIVGPKNIIGQVLLIFSSMIIP